MPFQKCCQKPFDKSRQMVIVALQSASMKLLIRCSIGLLAAQLGLAPLSAQPILLQPMGRGVMTGNDISNLKVGKQSADGTEVELTMDVTYDGMSGQSVRIVPVISDRKNPAVSQWFGAETKVVGQGRNIVITIKVKFFNDKPGVPAELTTNRVLIKMLNESGSSVVTQNPVLKTIKWGNPNIKPVPLERSAPVLVADAQATKAAKPKPRRTPRNWPS